MDEQIPTPPTSTPTPPSTPPTFPTPSPIPSLGVLAVLPPNLPVESLSESDSDSETDSNFIPEDFKVEQSSQLYALDNVVSGLCDDFVCVVCSQLMEHPIMLPCRRHVFHYACVKPHVTRAHNCPTCRKWCGNNSLKTIGILESVIQNTVTSRCPNHVNGCKVVNKLWELKQHQPICEHANVFSECCGENVLRKDVQDHAKVCVRTKCDLDECDFVGTVNEYKKHLAIHGIGHVKRLRELLDERDPKRIKTI